MTLSVLLAVVAIAIPWPLASAAVYEEGNELGAHAGFRVEPAVEG